MGLLLFGSKAEPHVPDRADTYSEQAVSTDHDGCKGFCK